MSYKTESNHCILLNLTELLQLVTHVVVVQGYVFQTIYLRICTYVVYVCM